MGVLNFNTDNLITGVNIIDGNLYWTDDNSEPKKLEIDRFRDFNHDGPSTRTGDNYVIESDLSVIRLHPWKAIELDLQPYVVTATQPEPPFEKIFPRFSYRWRYEDGQFSPYAPFTQAAFLPAARDTTNADIEELTETRNYTEGFNTTLYNNVGTINLNNIPRGPRDVVAVQLLYTESISSTIYTLETIDIPEAQRGLDYILSGSYVSGVPQMPDDYTLLPLSYSLSARKIYSALPANQLNRPYDEVPQKALAQEITANRLIYGNYQIGFDQPDALTLDAEFVDAGAGDGLHVKGNRTYEIGVAYIDAYGRQGAMVTAGSITAPDGTITEQIPLQSNFAQTTREQIEVTITSDPPTWADRYRYFIKDPSMDHHNLISYNIYNDGGAGDIDSEFIWIEFQSTDRNKVFEQDQALDGNTGTVLVLRRINDEVQGASSSQFPTKQRFLVQDIENEAPEDVRKQISQSVTNIRSANVGNIPHNVYNTTGDTGVPRPVVGATTWTWEPQGSLGSFQTAFDIFNRFIGQNQGDAEQDLLSTGHDAGSLGSVTNTTIDFSELSQSLYMRLRDRGDGSYYGGEETYVEVTQLIGYDSGGASNTDRLQITLGNHYNISDEGEVTMLSTTGWPGSPLASNRDADIELITTTTSDEAIERLGGRFWVRAARNGLTTAQSQFSFEGDLVSLNQFWFETEPAVAESNLDLFWESSETFCVCTQHGWANKLNWFNCLAEVEGGVYLESTRINDQFNSVQLVRGVRVNVPTDRNAVIERPYGLTWSGIYNSRTGINRLNQFITADGVTKELEPNYGSLQKLHTRDTNVIAFCEDKIFRILADKDLLFNADGGGNVASANAVLGQTTPFVGEYGISKNPESFASYGHNIWFSDAKRGVMCQLTPGNGQIFEISGRGLDDFFRDRLFSANKIIGMYDDYSDAYIVSVQGYDGGDAIIAEDDLIPGEERDINQEVTVKYETSVEGWPAFLSFIPESGLTLNNKFFTWKNGLLYMHNSNEEARNNFYGTQHDSSIQVIFNDGPSQVKEFLTLGYEGTAGWEVTDIDTESQDAAIGIMADWPFKSKEGKFFKPIVGMVDTYSLTDNGTTPIKADDGTTDVYITGQKEKSGIKGFYNNVTLTNSSTDAAELFAINTEAFVSSN